MSGVQLTWQWRAWLAGTSSNSLTTCSNAVLRLRYMSPEIDGSLMIDVTASFLTYWYHVIWMASREVH